MKRKILPVILLIATVALAVVSFLLLPDTVITQVGTGDSATTMSKPLAVALPTLLGAVPSLLVLFGKEDERRKTYLILSVVGVLVFVMMLLVNLL